MEIWRTALKDISLTIPAGIYGLLGRNGAGKTTTIRILMDVFHANSGEILLDRGSACPASPR